MVRPKVVAAEGRVGGGGAGDLRRPGENFVKKTQNPAFWELLAHCAACSQVEYSTQYDCRCMADLRTSLEKGQSLMRICIDGS